jgi:LysR family transcriptional regulator for bpeEF and oprC
VYPTSGRAYQWQFDTPDGRISLDVDAHLLINDGESVIQAAMAGLGIIQVPHWLAAGPVGHGKLEVIMQDTISTGSPVWIVYPQKKHLSARVHAFIDWIQEVFQRDNLPACRRAPGVETGGNALPETKRTDFVGKVPPRREPVGA